MTERMQAYRKRMEEKGLVQVKIWVDKQDEEFVKFLAKLFVKNARRKKSNIAKAVASANGLPEPKHLYDYHISLAAWM